MKSLLGLMIAGFIIGYLFIQKDSSGQSRLEKFNSEGGIKGNISKIEETAESFAETPQDRIDKEFK